MKMSYGWLKELVAGLPPPAETALKFSAAGLGVASVKPFTAAFEGIVVGEVLEASRHPNADRLSVCLVDAGGETFRVVCGAPNVRAGMKAPFALVGARLPGGKAITAAVIRGVQSQGMLCSAVEVGQPGIASGLLELPAEAVVGEAYAPAPDDWVLDLEVTPNRGDTLSAYGAARQLAATLGLVAKLPWELPAQVSAGMADWSVAIEDPAGCGWYTARLLTGITVGPSPEWMQRRLRACGMRPINNVVDVTNYVMLELGQPLHAFDVARLAGRRMTARRAAAGEVLKTLDGVSRALSAEVLVIADGAGPQAAAGVMGGASSEISAGTKDILLESAWFDPVRVRLGYRSLGLATESSYRFERGVDPGGVARASDRAAQLLVELAGATVASARLEARGRLPEPRPIELSATEVSGLLGVEVPAATIREALARLGCTTTGAGPTVTVTPPSWRPDLNLPADLAEEVAILHEYDRIPATMPRLVARPLPVTARDRILALIRETLRAAGFAEALTYSFTAPGELGKAGFAESDPERARAVPILNPLSEDHALMRTTLIPGLLRSAAYNLAREAPGVRMFEFGRVTLADGATSVEPSRLGLVAAGRLPQQLQRAERVLALADLEGAIAAAAAAIGVSLAWSAGRQIPFAPGRCAVASTPAGSVGAAGELTARAAAAFELPSGACAAELDLDALVAAAALDTPVIAPPRLPAVHRDLAVVAGLDVPAARLREVILRAGAPLLESADVFDIYTGRQVAAGSRSVAWRLAFRAADRTLTEPEVETAVGRITGALAAECQAAIRAV